MTKQRHLELYLVTAKIRNLHDMEFETKTRMVWALDSDQAEEKFLSHFWLRHTISADRIAEIETSEAIF